MAYCYSTDQENYFGSYGTEADALREALEIARDQGLTEVQTARIVPAQIFLEGRETYIVDQVLEWIDSDLMEEIDGDEEIVKLPVDEKDQLGKLVVKFLVERGAFKRYGVTEIKVHEVPEETKPV